MAEEANDNLPSTLNGMDNEEINPEDNPKTAEMTLAAAMNYSDCPVCFETLMPPIYQCCNGHIICCSCTERIDKCVECRVPLLQSPKIRNIALEKIINNLCVDCSNKNEGCVVKVTVEWLRNHLQVCPFTPFNLCSSVLGWKNCTYQANDISVLSHLEACHSITKVNCNTFRLCLNFSRIPMGENDDFFFEPIVVTSMGVPLLIRSVVSTNGFFTFTGFILENNRQDLQNIRLMFRIESQKEKVSFQWSGCVVSYRTFKETHVTNSFRIPVESVLEFCRPDVFPQGITSIIINVCIFEKSTLSQEDKTHEDVHIFEQNVFPTIVPNPEQTPTIVRSQSESSQSSGDTINFFYSPFENSFRD